MQVSAIIAAGGRGKRMDSGLSKQFLNIKGRPILCTPSSTFESIDMFHEM